MRQKNCNLGQNTCRLFFLAQFVFTTSETELDHYHRKMNVRVASQIVERLDGIFAAGGGLCAHSRKKKDFLVFSPLGELSCPYKKKRLLRILRILEN